MAKLLPAISPDTDPALAAPSAMPPIISNAIPAPDPGVPPSPDMGQPALPPAATAAPAPPQSSLPSVKPGEPIPLGQIDEATAMAGGPSPERTQATLKEYDSALHDVRMQKFDLLKDLHDPNFASNISKANAIEGQLLHDKASEKEANPWGSIGNHPGLGGKIGHAFGEIGNVVGNAVLGQNTMAGIPGTQAGIHQQEAMGSQEVADATKQGQEIAQTGAENATASEAPSKIALNTAQANAADNKEPAKGTPDEQVLAAGQKIASGQGTPADLALVKAFHDLQQAKQDVKPVKAERPDTPEQQFIDDEVKHGKTLQQAVRDYRDASKTPPSATNLIVTPNGQVEQAKPGMTLQPGTQNISGYASQGRPTTQMRNVAGQAQIVTGGIPDTIAEIDRLKSKLGPIAGRWNDFMQGKVGMDDPDFAGLRSDLLMTSSAVALMHARGRLPENLRAEFDNMINSPKQDPENLKAVLNHILPWAKKAQDLGNGPGPHQQGGEARHKIKIGNKQYTYNGSGDTADLKNYTEVAQ